MGKYAVAGVAPAIALDSSGNRLFRTTTLTDSGFNTSTSLEEIRGGAGHSLQATYNHTSKFEVTMKDCLIDFMYVALQTGSEITSGANIYTTETVVTTVTNQITVLGTPATFGTLGTIGWYSISGSADTSKITFTGSTATVSNLPSGSTVCVTYLIEDDSARVIEVLSNFIPAEIHLVFTLPLFKAGLDASNISNASQLGEWIVDVPRFKLDGALSLATTSTSAVSTDIKGFALSFVSTNGCGDKAIYATITEVIYNKDEFANVSSIVVSDGDLDMAVTDTSQLKVYKMYNDGTMPSVIDNSKLTFVSSAPTYATVASTGVVTAIAVGSSNISITVTSKTALSTYAVATVTA